MLRETARRAGGTIIGLFVLGCATTTGVGGRAPQAKAPSEQSHTTTPSHDESARGPQGAEEPSDAVEAQEEQEEQIDDGFDEPVNTVTTGQAPARPHPLASLSDAELERRAVKDVSSLGPMSIGRPSGGALFNGVQMPEGPYWTIVDAGDAWGTAETVRDLSAAISKVNDLYPGTQKLPIGHISAKKGGHLNPHLSHQSGRDVDVGYYYRDDARWYKRANADNLDLARTWVLVKALIVDSDVELILIDHSIQSLLRAHAESVGENRDWLNSLFKGRPGEPAIIRHAPGHTTHFHVRFYSPIAQETARRCVPLLVKLNLMAAPPRYVTHVARQGDTLAKLAKRYGTTIKEIQRANGLRSTLIQAKRKYLIPQSGARLDPTPPVLVPPRRLPPKA